MRLKLILKKVFELAIEFHRRLLIARAKDATVTCASRRSLVFAPHPDDETLGCGITILRKRDSGTAVTIVIAADGRYSHQSAKITPAQLSDIRRDEAMHACEILGVSRNHLVFLGYPDQHLAAHLGELSLKAKDLILETDPHEIYITTGIDSHPDHRALNAAVRSAAKEANYKGALFEYPIWVQTPGAWFDPEAPLPIKACQALFRPLFALVHLNPTLVRSTGYTARKRAAMDQYRSQTSNITGEATWSVLGEEFLRRFTERDEVFFEIKDT